MKYEDIFKVLRVTQQIEGAVETMTEFFKSDVLETFLKSSNVTEQLAFAANFVNFTDYLQKILDKYPHKKREQQKGMTDEEFRERAEEMLRQLKK